MQRKLWILVALTGSPMGTIDYPMGEFYQENCHLYTLIPVDFPTMGVVN